MENNAPSRKRKASPASLVHGRSDGGGALREYNNRERPERERVAAIEEAVVPSISAEKDVVEKNAEKIADMTDTDFEDEDGDGDDDDEEEEADDEGENDEDEGEDYYENEEAEYARMFPENDVEKQEFSVGGETFNLRVFEQKNKCGHEERYLEFLHVVVTHNGVEIGRGHGEIFRRDWVRERFWAALEEISEDTSSIAFGVFDRFGCIKKEYKEHVVRKGSGCWGDELNDGFLFILEVVHVEKAWCRNGIGKRMAEAIINKARSRKGSVAFTLLEPGFFNYEIRPELEGKQWDERHEIRSRAHDAVQAFYRSFGFRRIGASSCFGLATDPKHKAHAISPEDDFNPQEPGPKPKELWKYEDELFVPTYTDRSNNVGTERLKVMQELFPLHYAVVNLPDNEAVEFFKKTKQDETNYQWTRATRLGDNVPHLAAAFMKIKSVQWLLDNVDEGGQLSSFRNIRGWTPLESIEWGVGLVRDTTSRGALTVCISDDFEGHSEKEVECLIALRRMKNPTPVERLRVKFGCTCGQCVDGFLSPRMKFALLAQAEITHDMMGQDWGEEITGEDWCQWNDHLLTHVEPSVRQRFRTNKSIRRGFINLFNYAAEALRKNKAPTVPNILEAWEDESEWPPVTRNFFNAGGSATSVLRTIFTGAVDQDIYMGDGDHEYTFKEDIEALPECRNDHEFGFVALACGIPNLIEMY